ncbi:MAG: chromate transporter [Xanthobacteraceae bacterium]
MRDNPLIALIVVISPLSLLAIGGASAIYAPLQHQTVDVQQWLTGREYLEMFAIARVTPGPGSMLTTLIGWKVAGFAGALVATLALYVPCSVLCFAVARTWNRYRGTAWHTALENGLRPIGAGLMIAGGVMILRIEGSGILGWIVAFAVVGVMVWREQIHPMVLLFGGAAVFLAVRAVTG